MMAAVVAAIPAHKAPCTVTQPDGSTLTLRLHGDEYLHFQTTDDGYTVLRNERGFYVYAQREADGQLAPTARVAHDQHSRSLDETAWLRSIDKYMAPPMSERSRLTMQRDRQRRARASQQRREAYYNYDNFRGLILLVQFNDCDFTRSDYQSIITDMVNKENYHGYDNSVYGHYTGSVRDYFYDNSDGQFEPQFDVVGPVTLTNYSQFDPQSTRNANEIVKAAVDAADEMVDYSQYDCNDDGVVDLVFFIFAGIGANISGNSQDLIWPHAGGMYGDYDEEGNGDWFVFRDDIILFDYACSTELYGTDSWSILDGIGVICHEFGHVLGLPDLYDTDYEGSGGQSATPNDWSVMAGGGYQNYGRSPVGYTLYERYALGFATPQTINSEGSYTLQPIGTSNMGYRLDSRVDNEFFLIENRQTSNKWDRYAPGHGMLVFHVDSTDNFIWEINQVNCNPKHNCFDLLRAGGGTQDDGSNPFPGSRHVTELSNTSEPASLLTWSGLPSPWGFENIREVGSNVLFDVADVNVLRAVSLPEKCHMAQGATMLLEPVRTPEYAPYAFEWSSSADNVATVDAQGRVTGVGEGDAVITVVANDNAELTAQCTVHVEVLPVTECIADFKTLSDVGVLTLHEAEVLMVYDGRVYLRDTTGAVVVPQSVFEVNRNDVVDCQFYGQTVLTEGLPWLQMDQHYAASGQKLIESRKPQPVKVRLDSLTDRYYADYITIPQAKLEKIQGTGSGIYAVKGDRRVRLYNDFKLSGIKVPTDLTKYYDVTGILLTRRLDDETLVDELALFKSPVAVSAPVEESIIAMPLSTTDRVEVYDVAGHLLLRTTTDALDRLPLPRGIYIIRSARGTRKTVLPRIH